ncbi:MAG: cyclic nucleotide-binding domain-containing protein [Arenicellales bacterium]|jgi:CRP-like cAMP-binding protein
MNPLNLFSKSTETETYNAGDTIFSQGEPGDRLYVVRSGEVEIQANGVTVDTVGEGGIFGEMALIDSSSRSASAVARSDCEVIPVDEKRFTFLVQQTPFFAVHVMRVLADRLRKTNALLGARAPA